MDPLLMLCTTVGSFTRAQARDLGYNDRQIAAAVRHREWCRIRHGYYTFPELWEALGPEERHRVLCAAVLDSIGPGVALSHVSALVVHGVATWGLALDKIHVTRLDGGAGRLEAGVVHHTGRWTGDDLVEVQGLLVMAPDRAAIEAASRVGNEAALCVFDSTLHGGLCDHEQLVRRFEAMEHWPFVRHLHVPLRMADHRAESPGESRGRWLCWTAHLPAPDLQYEVYDSDGVLRGTTDFAWTEHKVLGEFDGELKYGRALRPGQQPGEVVFAEKQREDELRELTGFSMIRFVWADYDRPRVTEQRLRRRLRLAS